jgi:hypothetical protein
MHAHHGRPRPTGLVAAGLLALALLAPAAGHQADFAAARKLRTDMGEHMHQLGLSNDQIAGAHP